jgi:hypothetical protein
MLFSPALAPATRSSTISRNPKVEQSVMAKSSRVSVSKRSGGADRSLLTAAERALVDASEGKGLAQATRGMLQSWLARARETRDKWRGLLGRQTRASKRAPKAVAEANTRSLAKASLFDGVVKRFEAQMAALAPVTAKAGKPSARKAAPKRTRTAGHRAARAGVKSEMKTKAAALNSVVAKPLAKATAKTVPQQPLASKEAVVPRPVKPAAVKTAAKKAGAAGKAKRVPAVAGVQAIRFDGAKQRLLGARAKKARLASSGVVTQRGGHAMAAVKRSQARRDKRGR